MKLEFVSNDESIDESIHKALGVSEQKVRLWDSMLEALSKQVMEGRCINVNTSDLLQQVLATAETTNEIIMASYMAGQFTNWLNNFLEESSKKDDADIRRMVEHRRMIEHLIRTRAPKEEQSIPSGVHIIQVKSGPVNFSELIDVLKGELTNERG